MASSKDREVFVENAPLNEPISYKRDSDFLFAVVRKIDDGLYVINTRKGSYEVTGRTRVTISDASRSKDGVFCKTHDGWKHVTPSGALYCRGCSREYLKKWNADRRNGEPRAPRKTREERQQEIAQARAEERAASLQKSLEQGIRRTEAFFLDSARKHGESAARTTYGRYLSEERMTELLGVVPA